MNDKKKHELDSSEPSSSVSSPPCKKLKEINQDGTRNTDHNIVGANSSGPKSGARRGARMSLSARSPGMRPYMALPKKLRVNLNRDEAVLSKRRFENNENSNVKDNNLEAKVRPSIVEDLEISPSSSEVDYSDLDCESSEDSDRIEENDEELANAIVPEMGENGSVDSIPPECVDLFEDDEEDLNYRNINPNDMYCEVCDIIFKNIKRFISHHRRHSSKDHFVCPTCFSGFTNIKSCLNHEIKVHNKKKLSSSPGDAETSDANQPPGAGIYCCLEDEEEDESISKVPISSTCLMAYRGPRVELKCDSFEIERKYGPRGRNKSCTAVQIEKLKENPKMELEEEEDED